LCLLWCSYTIHERQRADGTEFNAKWTFFSTRAQVALEITVVGLVIEYGVVGTTGCTGATAVALIFQNDDHPPFVEEHSFARASQQAIWFITVFAGYDIELVRGHMLGYNEAGQTKIAFTFVVQRTGERARLTVTA
jgi:hypothetical protein